MSNATKLILPFSGEWFVLNGGDTKNLNHHHGNKAQNFALDFTKVVDNKSFKNNGKNNADFYCFGEPILCPADGEVIEAVDGVKDNKPGHGNYLAGAGNYVVIKHSEDEYSFIAHLCRGSVTVKAGDKIAQGQEVGKCGNSGASFAPHLHYHLQNSDVLVTYQSEYDEKDISKGNFPIKFDFKEYAAGINVQFMDVKVNGVKKRLHSPIRGELISNQAAR